MAITKAYNTKISGISACVPQNIVYNKGYKWISEKERKNLIKTVGVEAKHTCPKNIITSDLCYVAADGLIRELGWQRNEIDLLIFISQSRDYLLPATACILQERLNLPKTTAAFDMNMGCSAYNYGLSVTAAMMSNGGFKKGLLLTGDVASLGSYRDKTTFPIFGDAGTATAFEYKEGASPIFSSLQTDGTGYKAIIIPEGGFRKPPSKKTFDYKRYEKGVIRHKGHVELNGIEVFNFSLREVVPHIKNFLKTIEYNLSDIDFLVLHQANKLINETIRKMLRLEKEKVPLSLKEYGNISSASIPLTIVSKLNNQVTSQKLSMLLTGFGVGLSWGSNQLELDKIICPEVYIYEDYKKKYGIKQI
ncbi:MAG TPA: ketoacyl-ACP synthase III [Bacteroidales bacterium]|nr:ketoacyl-ACP synthase III [Bacteroidales bacterium]